MEEDLVQPADPQLESKEEQLEVWDDPDVEGDLVQFATL